jgi:PKHD-type hydroxylase
MGSAAAVKSCQIADFGASEKTFYSQEGAELLAKVTSFLINSVGLVTAALPRCFGAMRLMRYPVGGGYGLHADETLSASFRADLSFTVMLQQSTKGGGFYVDGRIVEQNDGSIFVYPSSTVHGVAEVREGERIVLVGWIESMVRDHGKRALLADIQRMIEAPSEKQTTTLQAVRNELLRRWGG